jgi:excisionase family DNA binding protein
MKGTVTIVHGANDGIFDDLLGVCIASVQASLIHAFNIPVNAFTFVNGVLVSRRYRLQADDTLEFIWPWGWKGVGERVWTDEEFCKFFKITSEDLQAWTGQGLKFARSLDGSLRITESAADEFFRGKVIESPYLTSEEAAVYLRTTVKGIYSILERGKLKKLSGSRTVLFTRDMLDAYVRGGEQ